MAGTLRVVVERCMILELSSAAVMVTVSYPRALSAAVLPRGVVESVLIKASTSVVTTQRLVPGYFK